MDKQNFGSAQSRTERLASALCISIDELESVSHEITGDSDEDGVLCGYVVQFSSYAPAKILKKIRGLNAANSAYVPASIIDNDAQSLPKPAAGVERQAAGLRRARGETS